MTMAVSTSLPPTRLNVQPAPCSIELFYDRDHRGAPVFKSISTGDNKWCLLINIE